MSIDPRFWERARIQANYDPIGDSQGAFANALADIGVPMYSPIGRGIASTYGPGLANAFLVSGAQTNRQLGSQTMQEQYKDYVTKALQSGSATKQIQDAYTQMQSGGFGDTLRGPYKAMMASGSGNYATPGSTPAVNPNAPAVGANMTPEQRAWIERAGPNDVPPPGLFPDSQPNVPGQTYASTAASVTSVPPGYSQGTQPWQTDMHEYITQNYAGNMQAAVADLISRGILPAGSGVPQLEELFMADTPKAGLGSSAYDQPGEISNEQARRMESEGYSLENGRYVYRGQPRIRPTITPPANAGGPGQAVAGGAAGPQPGGVPGAPSTLRPQPALNPYVGALLSLLYDPSALAGFQQGLAAPLMGSSLAGGLRDLTGLRMMGAQRTMSPTDDFFRALYGR